MVSHVQSDPPGIFHARNGERFLASLREKEDDAAKRTLARCLATCIEGGHAWASSQGLAPREETESKVCRETMGGSLNWDDALDCVGRRCYATGCQDDITKINTLCVVGVGSSQPNTPPRHSEHPQADRISTKAPTPFRQNQGENNSGSE